MFLILFRILFISLIKKGLTWCWRWCLIPNLRIYSLWTTMWKSWKKNHCCCNINVWFWNPHMFFDFLLSKSSSCCKSNNKHYCPIATTFSCVNSRLPTNDISSCKILVPSPTLFQILDLFFFTLNSNLLI